MMGTRPLSASAPFDARYRRTIAGMSTLSNHPFTAGSILPFLPKIVSCGCASILRCIFHPICSFPSYGCTFHVHQLEHSLTLYCSQCLFTDVSSYVVASAKSPLRLHLAYTFSPTTRIPELQAGRAHCPTTPSAPDQLLVSGRCHRPRYRLPVSSVNLFFSSGDTSKPASWGHFKTGQLSASRTAIVLPYR